ncbi:MAG TPA: hypothetical protein VGN00_18155 [Puia sp.]
MLSVVHLTPDQGVQDISCLLNGVVDLKGEGVGVPYPTVLLAAPFFLADIAGQLDRIIFGNAVESDPDVDRILPILIYLFPSVPDRNVSRPFHMLNLLNEGKKGCKTNYKTIPKIQQNQPESKK